MESDLTIQSHTKRYVPKLLEKYCDLKKIDKVYAAQENVSEIQNIMADNLIKAQASSEKLDVSINSFSLLI